MKIVSSLLYGTRDTLVLNLPPIEIKKYTAYDRFHGNGPYGEIPTKKEHIRTLGFALPYNNITYSVANVVIGQFVIGHFVSGQFVIGHFNRQMTFKVVV